MYNIFSINSILAEEISKLISVGIKIYCNKMSIDFLPKNKETRLNFSKFLLEYYYQYK